MLARHPAISILRAGLIATLLAVGPAGCGPQNSDTAHSPADPGRTSAATYGTIIGTPRPLVVRGQGGKLGGTALAGLAGNATGQAASTGQAVEFTVREDAGTELQVVQTNEEGLRAGDRVVISRGDRTRLSRAAGGPPPAAPQSALSRPGVPAQASPPPA
jgi:outer membrane lipoprotein SlyB